MLDNETKRRIDTARDILVGKVPDPKSQVEQITIALIYKFMDDMDSMAEELGGARTFFSGEFEKYGWSRLMARDLGGFEVINLYSDAIQQMDYNPNIPQLFRDIFKNAFLPYRDPETLKSFLKIIDDFEYDHSERLGDAFEYLLSVLGSQGEAGQFRTPRHIIDFMVEIIDPKKDETILDPACGTAGFLISSYKHILKHNSSNWDPEQDQITYENGHSSAAEKVVNGTKYKGDRLTPDERKKLFQNVKGYDISPDMVRLSLVNLYLHGFTDPNIVEYDTLTSDENWNQFAAVILANPPFMSPKGGIKPHNKFSVQSKRSEVLFVDYIAEHLTPDGRAAVIVPEGIIFQSGTAYKQLREMLVKEYLYGVVSLPAGVFNPYSGVKTSILLMDKALAKKSSSIIFVKIENDGFDLGAQRKTVKDNDIPGITKLLKRYIHNLQNNEKSVFEDSENVLVVDKENINEGNGWDLSGERYKLFMKKRCAYELVNLGDVCKLVGGGTPSRKRDDFWHNGTIKWISSKHIDDNGNIIGYELITNEAVGGSSTNVIPPNSTILITRVSVGKTAYTTEEVAINQDLTGLVIIDEETLHPKFLFLLSFELAEIIEKNAQGLGVRGVTRKFVAELEIPLPPMKVQQRIISEIEELKGSIRSYEKLIESSEKEIKTKIANVWESEK